MKKINEYIDISYHSYLKLLRELVSVNSVYSNIKGIKQALQYCKNHFEKNLLNFHIYFDKKENLICVNKLIDKNKDIVYLSAHVDTVTADEKLWDKRFSPFIPFEDKESIVGRGVSDDKSGVAFQLLLAELIHIYFPKSTNIVFTISYREEQGGISALEIGRKIGETLPVGPKTYIFTLENNTKITHPPTLYINYGERGTIAIEIVNTLEKIREFLLEDKNLWNPTVIFPTIQNIVSWDVIEQKDGHAATTPRENNLIFQLLIQTNVNQLLLSGGNENAISSIPKTIKKARTRNAVEHKVIFDLRTLKSVAELLREIDRQQMKYRFIKSLDHGYYLKDMLFKDKIYRLMNKISIKNLRIKYELNPGSTDSGTIYKAIKPEFKKSVLPVVMGPGSRSQRDAIPPRMTHGVNETFDKQTGLSVIKYISQLLYRMQFLIPIKK